MLEGCPWMTHQQLTRNIGEVYQKTKSQRGGSEKHDVG
jgi:hypothetical protein